MNNEAINNICGASRLITRKAALVVAAVIGSTFVGAGSGCNNAAEGGLSGAGLGAGAGAIIGSLYGDAGKGALIGLAGGALSGAVIGDQNERRSREYYGRPSYSSGYSSSYGGPVYYERYEPRVVYEERVYIHDYNPRDRYCR